MTISFPSFECRSTCGLWNPFSTYTIRNVVLNTIYEQLRSYGLFVVFSLFLWTIYDFLPIFKYMILSFLRPDEIFVADAEYTHIIYILPSIVCVSSFRLYVNNQGGFDLYTFISPAVSTLILHLLIFHLQASCEAYLILLYTHYIYAAAIHWRSKISRDYISPRSSMYHSYSHNMSIYATTPSRFWNKFFSPQFFAWSLSIPILQFYCLNHQIINSSSSFHFSPFGSTPFYIPLQVVSLYF